MSKHPFLNIVSSLASSFFALSPMQNAFVKNVQTPCQKTAIATRSASEVKCIPENRRLIYCAITIIAIVIILLLSMTIWADKISFSALPIMRGCAGLGAALFVVIVGV